MVRRKLRMKRWSKAPTVNNDNIKSKTHSMISKSAKTISGQNQCVFFFRSNQVYELEGSTQNFCGGFIVSILICLLFVFIDVWSFGVLSWELLTLGQRPYATSAANEVVAYLLAGNRLPQPDRLEPVFALVFLYLSFTAIGSYRLWDWRKICCLGNGLFQPNNHKTSAYCSIDSPTPLPQLCVYSILLFQ